MFDSKSCYFNESKLISNFSIVFETLSSCFEYPPPPNVQSIYMPPFKGEVIFITSLNITGKWDKSSDDDE